VERRGGGRKGGAKGEREKETGLGNETNCRALDVDACVLYYNSENIECGPAACAQVGRAADAKDKGSEGEFRASVARKAVCQLQNSAFVSPSSP